MGHYIPRNDCALLVTLSRLWDDVGMTNPTLRCTVILAVVLAACGTDPAPEPDYFIDNVGVIVNTTEPWVLAPDFKARLHNTIVAALNYGNGSLADLNGHHIIFQDAPIPCESTTGTCKGTLSESTITIDVSNVGGDCLENTALAHEIIHALIGDACHTSALWHSAMWEGQGFASYAMELNANHATTCYVVAGHQIAYSSC